MLPPFRFDGSHIGRGRKASGWAGSKGLPLDKSERDGGRSSVAQVALHQRLCSAPVLVSYIGAGSAWGLFGIIDARAGASL